MQRMRERVKVFTLLQPPPNRVGVCVRQGGGQEWGEVATIDQFSVRVNASSLSQTHRISLSREDYSSAHSLILTISLLSLYTTSYQN